MKITTQRLDSGRWRILRGQFRKSRTRHNIMRNILAEPVSYVPDARFQDQVFTASIMVQRIDIPPDTSLKAEQTETLFLQFNYARYMINRIRCKLLDSLIETARPKDRAGRWETNSRELLYWYEKQIITQGKIVAGNMGLVLAMAKSAHYYNVDFTDLISEGSMALLRASDKFDCGRGYKFSTYACRAILKSFSRAAKCSYRYRSLFPTQLDSTIENDDYLDQLRKVIQEDKIEEIRSILHNNTAALSLREQSVLTMRFPLNENSLTPMSLKEIGRKLGLSKERIRQIQNKALQKLRCTAEKRMVFM
ncbi:MAG: sigma-70 family RNA polymerase sigma factor [Sedimentisphaerales bacterium]|nr:sigma-70 family RNA polymerase sigma factor [Sedimentisphaerales bacterium]